MALNKSDQHARDNWGSAYDAIPKSVFATMAYYLAGACVDSAENQQQVHARILEELDALSDQIIDGRQGRAAIRAWKTAMLELERA